jgi:multisubunit Na+/H+ antiporter MnhB subunit
MDALLGLRSGHWRATDWTAAAVSGLAAGAVLMVLDLVWSLFFNPDGPWRTSHMIAPVFTGADSLKTSGYEFSPGVVALSLATHYVLGILFGLVMGAILAQLRLDATPGRALVGGAVLGIGLYLINFDVLSRFFFPWLADLRGWDTLGAHVVFGIAAALLYWRFKRPNTEH